MVKSVESGTHKSYPAVQVLTPVSDRFCKETFEDTQNSSLIAAILSLSRLLNFEQVVCSKMRLQLKKNYLFHKCHPPDSVDLSPESVNLYFPYAGQGLLFFHW